MRADVEDAADGTLVRGGRVRTGTFALPLRRTGLERADGFGCALLRPLMPLRRREWFGFGVATPDLVLGTLTLGVGPVAYSGLYVFERATGALWERGFPAFGPERARIATGPWDDRTLAVSGRARVAYRHLLSRGRHEVSIDLPAAGDAPPIQAGFAMLEDPARVPPLVVSVPVTGRWWMYTHKAWAPVAGEVRVGDRTYRLDPARDLANLDEHRAAYPWTQDWTWATFGGRDASGRLLAANLCANRHYADPDGGNENRLWVGDRLDPLGAVAFALDPRHPLRPWTVNDARGAVDLAFHPEGAKHQHTRIGPARLDYFQVFGHWRGRVVDADGATHAVRDLPGLAEQGVGRN